MARSIPRSRSANDVERQAFAPRWGRSETPTTTRWRRASSPRSNVSCSIGVASRRRPKRAWPSSNSSRASTIRAGGTHRSAICHPSRSNANMQPPLSNPVHTSMPSCSRRSRSGLETSQQVAPPAYRPSVTATRHGGVGNMQAGTKRCSGRTKRSLERGGQNAVKPDTLIPRPHLSTKPGQVQIAIYLIEPVVVLVAAIRTIGCPLSGFSRCPSAPWWRSRSGPWPARSSPAFALGRIPSVG